jgi:hypothetical protein
MLHLHNSNLAKVVIPWASYFVPNCLQQIVQLVLLKYNRYRQKNYRKNSIYLKNTCLENAGNTH